MRKPRTNILLLTIIFVIVGLVGQAWLAKEPVSAALVGSDPLPLAVVSPVLPFENALLAVAKLPDDLAGSGIPSAHFPAMPPQQLPDDANVLVTEMCGLQLMSEGADLALNSNQWAAFAKVMLRFQAIQHTYEAKIADLQEIGPGHYRAEIPLYAKAGDKLREEFSTELRAELGEPMACEVMAKLGDRLERRFAGFGVSVQTLDITTNPAGKPNDIQVTRTVSYWNSVDGSDRLTTRREIYFPALEDPTGDSWSALLAKVGVAREENGPG